MLFDAHIHFFPDKLKDKVYPKLSKIAGVPYFRDETLDNAIKFNQSMGGTHCLGLHIATNPTQQDAVNSFAISSQSSNVLNFGSIHPKSENPIQSLHTLKEMGIKGIKLHPDYQEFIADDKEMFDIYKTCEDLNMIITFHTGKDPYSPTLVHCSPTAIANIAQSFPKLRIISAHMGGMEMADECLKHLAGTPNVYLDTAMASSFLDAETFKLIAQTHGIDRILFGTDCPWSTIETEQNFINQINFSSADFEKIYYKNAFELFNL